MFTVKSISSQILQNLNYTEKFYEQYKINQMRAFSAQYKTNMLDPANLLLLFNLI